MIKAQKSCVELAAWLAAALLIACGGETSPATDTGTATDTDVGAIDSTPVDTHSLPGPDTRRGNLVS